mgnify:CR=1 FL=1
MIVGTVKEIKNHEYRVGLIPGSVRELTHRGHDVFVQASAGAGIGVLDEEYTAAGATILPDAAEVFDTAELIVKVKEPQAEERAMLREDHTLFTYLHLAPDAPQTADLVASGACCIAYETVTDRKGRLPLLAPMSEVAGRLSIQAGAWCLEKAHGGLGVLLGGVPGVEPAKVVIIGGGTVGFNAAQMAIGLGVPRETLRLVDNDGRVSNLPGARWEMSPLARWRSPDTDADYPVAWRLVLPARGIDIQVQAAFDDQLMDHAVRYWEGAVDVQGSHSGIGYLEMSGYSPGARGEVE